MIVRNVFNLKWLKHYKFEIYRLLHYKKKLGYIERVQIILYTICIWLSYQNVHPTFSLFGFPAFSFEDKGVISNKS